MLLINRSILNCIFKERKLKNDTLDYGCLHAIHALHHYYRMYVCIDLLITYTFIADT